MCQLLSLLVVTLALCAWPDGRSAATMPKRPPSVQQTENVRAELVAERRSVTPGEKLRIGLHQRIKPGWHTYWRNPGDSGLPTHLQWSVPEGVRVGPTLWPAPARFAVGPIVNYGYAGDVVLLADLDVPTTARAGEAMTILLRAEWLVCEEICIPEEAELSLTLPIGEVRGQASLAETLIGEAAARVPVSGPWQARFASAGERLVMQLIGADLAARPPNDAYFFPGAPDALEHAAAQRFAATADGLVLELTPANRSRGLSLDSLEGVLAFNSAGAPPSAFTLTATRAPLSATALAAFDAPALPLWQALFFAFLGGLLLNLMPCVLPVLSMKALALVAHAQRDAAGRMHEGIAYAAGVITCFLAIAGLVLGLRTAGVELGWGFQFQSPIFVAGLAGVTLAVGLSLSGVFHLTGGRLADLGDGLARRSDGIGAYFTGLLAAVVATPCTAPFMGAALGVALLAPAAALIAILASMGLGLALPFLVFSMVPGAARWLPRPGAWMDRLKQILAFPMYATTAWLVWVLSQQVGPEGLAIAFATLVVIAFAAWAHGALSPQRPTAAHLTALVLLVVIAAMLARMDDVPPARGAGVATGSSLASEPFDAERLARLRAEGRPVFVNMTAAWCITCIVNERATLSGDAIRDRFVRHQVVYLVGDWTQRDPAITAYLREFGRSGVPLYVAYPVRGGTPVVLPQILTRAMVEEALTLR